MFKITKPMWKKTNQSNSIMFHVKYSVSTPVSTELQVLVLYSICKTVVSVHPYLLHIATGAVNELPPTMNNLSATPKLPLQSERDTQCSLSLNHQSESHPLHPAQQIPRLYFIKKTVRAHYRRQSNFLVLWQSGKDTMSKICYRQIYAVVYHITNVMYRVDLNIRQLLNLWSFPLSHSAPPFSLPSFPFARLSSVISFVILPLFPLAPHLQF